MDNRRFIAPLLILVTIAAFYRALSCQFVNYDDPLYVTANRHVLGGLTGENVRWALTTNATHATDPTANYHPLTWLSLMLDSQLMGKRIGPGGYHLTNVLLHTLTAVLLYLALQSMSGAPWRSGLVALLFAIHPLRVESVAWISERKDVLSACLGVAAILAYSAYARKPGWRRYLLVLLLLALGLFAKPMLVTLPLLLLLLDVWPLRRLEAVGLPAPSAAAPACPARPLRALIIEKLPLLALSAASCVMTYLVQHRGGAVRGIGELPWRLRLANVPVSYVRYLEKMVWFRGLIIDYPFPIWPWWLVAGSSVGVVAITVAVIVRWRRNPWLGVGWFWFLGMLVPVIGFVQVGNQSLGDRYTYLPTIGLLVMGVWSLPEGLFRRTGGRWALVAATVAVAVTLGAFTYRQIGYWQNSIALFGHLLAVMPDNEIALNNLGIELGQAGQHEQALAYFQRAVQIQPNSPQVQTNLGAALLRAGRLDDAVRHLRRAIEIEPNRARPHNALGDAYLRSAQPEKAIGEFRLAMRLEPEFAPPHAGLGNALMTQKHYAEALGEYAAALSLAPDDTDSLYNAGWAQAAMGQYQAAIPIFQEVMRRQPGLARGPAGLGSCWMLLGRVDQALPLLERAVELEPRNASYRAQLEQARQYSQQPPAFPAPPSQPQATP